MTRLSPRAKELLEQCRAAERRDSPDLARMEQDLFGKLARGETALTGIDAVQVALPRASWLARLGGSTAAKLNTVLLITAAGATTIWYGGKSAPEPAAIVRHAPPAPPPAAPPPAAAVVELQPTAADAPTAVALMEDAQPPALRKPKLVRARRTQPVAVEEAVPEPEAAAPEPALSEPSVPPNSPAQWHRVESPLDSEVGLLRRAYKELNANRPERALEALKEHAYRFPRGDLTEAREVAHMLALCGVEREAEALARAKRFLAQRPASPFAGRVRALCPLVLPKIEP